MPYFLLFQIHLRVVVFASALHPNSKDVVIGLVRFIVEAIGVANQSSGSKEMDFSAGHHQA